MRAKTVTSAPAVAASQRSGLQAEIAAECLADLEAAVDARRRRGSWQPGAAISWHDFRELG